MTPLDPAELLARLIAFPSVSTESNVPIADFVCNYLEPFGIACERFPYADGRKVNVYAQIGPRRDDRAGLILCGHLDVVPADEPHWTSDPFRLVERDGRFVARGAADMKGFVALAIDRLVRARTGQPARDEPLGLLLTADEEIGSVGAAALARAWPAARPLPTACVIGEPTSLRVVRMHKGHLKLRVRITGRAAHSGSPHLGINAIEPLGAIIAALADLRRELEQERCDTSAHFAGTPFVVLNLAHVHGGDALNVIPEQAALSLGLRLLPGMDAAAMLQRVQAAVVAAADGRAAAVTVELIHDNPPMLCPPDAAIHARLCALLTQETALGVSYASDAGVLQRDLGLECVLFGPGDIAVAHRPDECLEIAEFHRAADLLAKLTTP